MRQEDLVSLDRIDTSWLEREPTIPGGFRLAWILVWFGLVWFGYFIVFRK